MAEAGIHLLVDTIENADAQFHQQKQYFVASMHSLMRVLFQGKELAAKNVGAYTEIGRGGEVLADMEEGQEENREETAPDPSREEQGGGVELEHGFLAEEIGGAVEEAGGAVEDAGGAVEEAGGPVEEAAGAVEEAGGALEEALEIERNVDEDEATIPEPVAEELEADLNVEQATAVTIPETELDVAMEPIAEPSPEALVGSLEPEENLSSGERLEEEHPDQEEVDRAAELQHDISDPEREDRCEVEAIEQTIEQTIEEHLSEQVQKVDDDDSTEPILDSNEVEQANEEPEPEPEELVADEPEYDFSSQNREDPTAVGRDSHVDRRREDSLEEPGRANSFSFVRPGSFSFTEPERQRSFSFVKPGREDGLVEPEREDSFIDPGREDSLVESRQEYSIERGGGADLIEPSRGDSLVDPGREETGGAVVDQERIQAKVLPEPDREEQVGEAELITDRDDDRADSQPGWGDRSEADRIVDGDDDQGYAVHEEGGGGSISVQTNLVSNLRSFLPLVKKADTGRWS